MIPLAEIQRYNNDLSLAQIEGIFYIILNESPLTNAELVRKTGLPKETLRRFKASISSFLEDMEDDKILLKKEYSQESVAQNFQPYEWSLVDYSASDLISSLQKIRQDYMLDPKRQFDQFFATEETSVNKVLVMKGKGDIKGKRVALLGDDDLLSAVLGMSSPEYSQLVVLDVDRDILKVVEAISRDYEIRDLRAEFYDARKKLRDDLLGRFDTVVIDPPYTLNGVRLFLNRALELLGTTPGKRIYLYYGNSFKVPERTLQIQTLLSRYNLLIKDKIDNFARYYGAESIGSSSSLYILETLSNTKCPSDAPVTDIYTYQASHRAEFPYVEHYVFKLYDVPEAFLRSKSQLQQSLGKFCKYHRLKVMNTEVTHFSGGGYTFNYTLASSNLTVHTWPEMGALHFVLVTCSPVQKSDILYDNLSLLFKTDKVEIEKIE